MEEIKFVLLRLLFTFLLPEVGFQSCNFLPKKKVKENHESHEIDAFLRAQNEVVLEESELWKDELFLEAEDVSVEELK